MYKLLLPILVFVKCVLVKYIGTKRTHVCILSSHNSFTQLIHLIQSLDKIFGILFSKETYSLNLIKIYIFMSHEIGTYKLKI